jgi:hypothetical protein
MQRIPLRLLSLLLLLALAGGVSHAGIIAQYDVFADGGIWTADPFYNNYVMAQSFVPTVSGTVVSVDTTIHRYSTSSTTIPIQLSITGIWNSGLNGLQPDFSNVLSTGTVSALDPVLNGTAKAWVNAVMTPATLSAGTTYMLVATAAGTNLDYVWYEKYGSGTTGYASGNELIGYIGDSVLGNQSGYDLPFRINGADEAAVPEPTTFVGLGIGLVVLCASKRRIAAIGHR